MKAWIKEKNERVGETIHSFGTGISGGWRRGVKTGAEMISAGINLLPDWRISAQMIASLIVGCGLVLTLVPWLKALKDTANLAASTASLGRVGNAIARAETDLGYLPKADWEGAASAYERNLQDPVFQKQNTVSQLTGWGRNIRTELTLNSAKKEDPEKQKTAGLPDDAILMGPSGENTMKPDRNGTVPPGQKNENNPTPTQHTLRLNGKGAYLMKDGSISILTPEGAAEKMRIRVRPISETVEQNLNAETKKVQDAWKKAGEGKAVYSGYISLSEGEVETPKVPVGDPMPSITFEAYSSAGEEITTVMRFLNSDEKEINYLPDAEQTIAATHIDLIGNPAKRYTPENKTGRFGFNAENGHGEEVPQACYKKGSMIVALTDTSTRKQVAVPAGEWINITQSPEVVPAHTAWIRLTIMSPGKATIIRNLRAEFPSAPQAPIVAEQGQAETAPAATPTPIPEPEGEPETPKAP